MCDFISISRWLEEQANKTRFADISVNLKIHEGQIALVEKTVTEKSKISTGTTGSCYGKR